MKIPLTQGQFAIIDEEDYELLSKWKWRYESKGYASREQHLGGSKENRICKILGIKKDVQIILAANIEA